MNKSLNIWLVLSFLLAAGIGVYLYFFYGSADAPAVPAVDQPPVIVPVKGPEPVPVDDLNIAPPAADMDELNEITKGNPVDETANWNLPVIGETDHIYGDETTPIAIIGYFSFNQQNSKNAFEALRSFVDRNTSRVHLVFRHYPFSDGVQVRMAVASDCVAAQQKSSFWSLVEKLYEKDYTEAEIPGLITGVDQDEFTLCYGDFTTEYRIRTKVNQIFTQTGLDVVPAQYFVNISTGNSKRVLGANGQDYLESVLAEM